MKKQKLIIFGAAVLLTMLVPFALYGYNLAVYSADEGLDQDNTSIPKIYVENNGSEALSGFVLYYYFTSDSGNTPIVDDYHTPFSEISLEPLGNTQYRIKRADCSDFVAQTKTGCPNGHPGKACRDSSASNRSFGHA